MCNHYIAYYRVSTKRQGQSGLGLEGQQMAVQSFLRGKDSDAMLLESYTEIESGKRSDRAQLAKAVEHARLTGSRLLIAKLDRLSRNVHFLSGLKEAGIKFTAVDMPDANELMINIMAAFAEAEAKMISERTITALKAWKARNPKKSLGNPKGARALRLAGKGNDGAIAVVKANADLRANGLRGRIDFYKAEGITSANGIAKKLNDDRIVTARGGKWTAKSVINVMSRWN